MIKKWNVKNYQESAESTPQEMKKCLVESFLFCQVVIKFKQEAWLTRMTKTQAGVASIVKWLYCVKYRIFNILTFVKVLRERKVLSVVNSLCGNCAFPQNFRNRKLDGVTVFHAVLIDERRYTLYMQSKKTSRTILFFLKSKNWCLHDIAHQG